MHVAHRGVASLSHSLAICGLTFFSDRCSDVPHEQLVVPSIYRADGYVNTEEISGRP
jgi:hypothetical protein